MSIFVPTSQAGGQATAWRHATFPSAHGTLHPCYSCGASDSGGFPPCGGMLWVYCRHCSQVKAHLCVRLSLCLPNRKGGGAVEEAKKSHFTASLLAVDLSGFRLLYMSVSFTPSSHNSQPCFPGDWIHPGWHHTALCSICALPQRM